MVSDIPIVIVEPYFLVIRFVTESTPPLPASGKTSPLQLELDSIYYLFRPHIDLVLIWVIYINSNGRDDNFAEMVWKVPNVTMTQSLAHDTN